MKEGKGREGNRDERMEGKERVGIGRRGERNI